MCTHSQVRITKKRRERLKRQAGGFHLRETFGRQACGCAPDRTRPLECYTRQRAQGMSEAFLQLRAAFEELLAIPPPQQDSQLQELAGRDPVMAGELKKCSLL